MKCSCGKAMPSLSPLDGYGCPHYHGTVDAKQIRKITDYDEETGTLYLNRTLLSGDTVRGQAIRTEGDYQFLNRLLELSRRSHA